MYQATSTWANCSAHITTNRNRSKIYEGNQVYLKDKQHFEIELYNPTQFRVLAKISINGRSISNSGIVLRPAERVYLERFIDDKNKFLFETYEVEDTKESKEAISKNGLIEVSFYPEISTNNSYNGCYTFTTHNPFNTPFTVGGSGDYIIGNPYTINCDGIVGANYSTCVSDNVSFGGTTSNTVSYFTNTSSFENKSLETGRIEKGKSSNQSFKITSGNFSWAESNTVSYRILPESSRPVEMSGIRNYCSGCGTRIKKSSWKFCPSCGEKI
jgi:hypothetical protein